jgi:hypothetical protein
MHEPVGQPVPVPQAPRQIHIKELKVENWTKEVNKWFKGLGEGIEDLGRKF